MPSHVEDYTKNVLKVVVAQVCQIIGWNAIHQSSLEVLVDTLDRFMQELTKQTYRITELYQRTEPTLDDLALAFHYLNINLNDIKEYIDYVGPPESIPAIPKYPAPPPQILNVKRLADDVAAEQANAQLVLHQPKAEDSEDEELFASLFQYNREYKTEITESIAGEDGGLNGIKKEDTGDGKTNANGEDGRDNKSDALKKTALIGRTASRKKHTTVQLTPGGRIQGAREGRLPCAEIPAIFQSEIEAATHLEQQTNYTAPDIKQSKPKSHKHHHSESNGGGGGSGSGSRAGTPSFQSASSSGTPGPSSSSSTSSKRHKLSQEPDVVKSNIFKKISHPSKHSPQQSFTSNVPVLPNNNEVIDIDSSPNPTPVYSPAPQPSVPPVVKKEKKEKKKKDRDRSHRESQSFTTTDSSLLGLPPLPAGTTLEAIPMNQDPEPAPAPSPSLNPFLATTNPAFFPGVPNFSLPQGPGLIPFGGLPMEDVSNMSLPPALAGLNQRVPGLLSQASPGSEHSPRRKEKEAKKQKRESSSAGLNALPPNLFLPDTTVRVESVVKKDPDPVPVEPNNTIDLLSDDEVDSKPSVAELDASASAISAAAEKAAKKAEKQRKKELKEQRRLEKLAAAAAASSSTAAAVGDDGPMNLSLDGGEVMVKKEKPSKMERKMEKMLLKKMLKSKKGGDEGGEPVDLSMLDQEKQRKLEKKLKKLQKMNKAKMKAQAAEEAARGAVAEPEPVAEPTPIAEAALPKSPEPQLLPKLTLKLNSPKVGDMLHSPKEAHSGKDYRPLTVDTGDPMLTPVKRMKSGSAQNSPSMRPESVMPPVEPELAKISPLVTRPMKQSHHSELPSPSSSSGRGRPKGSSSKSHSSTPVLPAAAPVKTEEVVSAGGGNQVWICPACGRIDDGSPMIGCDGCDNWYHWLCVGIREAPESSEDWFCRVCLLQRKEMAGDGLGFGDLSARKREKKKKKKEKRMKMEESD